MSNEIVEVTIGRAIIEAAVERLREVTLGVCEHPEHRSRPYMGIKMRMPFNGANVCLCPRHGGRA